MTVYEHRARIYTCILNDPKRLYSLIEKEVSDFLQASANSHFIADTRFILALDHALSPRCGSATEITYDFDFDALSSKAALDCLSLPCEEDLAPSTSQSLLIKSPGGVGSILKDPDGHAGRRKLFSRPSLRSELPTLNVLPARAADRPNDRPPA